MDPFGLAAIVVLCLGLLGGALHRFFDLIPPLADKAVTAIRSIRRVRDEWRK
ncbi:hypothetical protein ACIQUU_32035 [Streptomyces sp. NPDC101116]|uniref:hypothetical protein n=1 Tax=Streptomyces sp. NPDC101116 TaxID=3366107 RepID=UPI00381C91A9